MVSDRTIEIPITDDEEAPLSISQTTATTENETTATITVENQFTVGTTLEQVTVSLDDEETQLEPLAPGERDTATFEPVDCDSEIVIKASSPTTSISLTRPVEC
ncbi:hypothetical protein ACFQGT_18200 [Natrialbaceae archaeon GCM10025810]|uniref:hypothetical protein n=1 Tax=Halovalidus salilacus TaxID=3075124 RepID=UPI00361177D5